MALLPVVPGLPVLSLIVHGIPTPSMLQAEED